MALARRTLILSAAASPLLTLIPGGAFAAQSRVYVERGIAVDGTDVLSYFDTGAPAKGSTDFTHDWNGATWLFTSAENRDRFAENPEAFAPQFGGYCAYAVSEGYIASTVPDAWKIVDGKLYLNYSRRIQRRWERDIPGRIAAGNANWPDVLR